VGEILMNSDFKDLLKLFAGAGVRYMVVGGYAVTEHTEPRYTKDLDLWVDNSDENAERVVAALREFGAPLLDATVHDFTVPTTVYQIGLPPSRIDILMSLEGLDFGDSWNRRKNSIVAEIPVAYISLADLIVNKELAGRPQDLIDAQNLRRQLGK
jgi:hypothetical protein